MEIFVLGLFTAFNFIVLKWKYDHDRRKDMFIDVIILAILNSLFGGTMGGMAIAMVGGAFISLYLLVSTDPDTVEPAF